MLRDLESHDYVEDATVDIAGGNLVLQSGRLKCKTKYIGLKDYYSINISQTRMLPRKLRYLSVTSAMWT